MCSNLSLQFASFALNCWKAIKQWSLRAARSRSWKSLIKGRKEYARFIYRVLSYAVSRLCKMFNICWDQYFLVLPSLIVFKIFAFWIQSSTSYLGLFSFGSIFSASLMQSIAYPSVDISDNSRYALYLRDRHVLFSQFSELRAINSFRYFSSDCVSLIEDNKPSALNSTSNKLLSFRDNPIILSIKLISLFLSRTADLKNKIAFRTRILNSEFDNASNLCLTKSKAASRKTSRSSALWTVLRSSINSTMRDAINSMSAGLKGILLKLCSIVVAEL